MSSVHNLHSHTWYGQNFDSFPFLLVSLTIWVENDIISKYKIFTDHSLIYHPTGVFRLCATFTNKANVSTYLINYGHMHIYKGTSKFFQVVRSTCQYRPAKYIWIKWYEIHSALYITWDIMTPTTRNYYIFKCTNYSKICGICFKVNRSAY